MKISSKLIKGTDVYSVTLENDNGVMVELLSWGACIRQVSVKDGNGYRTLTQSFADYDEYLVRNTGYNGKTLAPCAGRISGTEGLTIGDFHFVPEINERGINSLHGSRDSASIINWKIEKTEERENDLLVSFSAALNDGLCGWPGNREFTADYTLNNDNVLSISYKCRSDKDTYVNMSNHLYWNLNADPDKSLDQLLTINAESMVINGDDALPYKTLPVEEIRKNDGVDFTETNVIRNIICPEHDTEYGAQIRSGNGIDNGFILDRNRDKAEYAVKLESGDGKYAVEFLTDASAVVIYTNGGMKEGIKHLDGSFSKKSCSVAVELQEIPLVEHPQVVKAGELCTRSISFRIIR